MTDASGPKIAFIGWNPFQLLHVRGLVAALPGACFVVEHRKDYLDDFGEELLHDPAVPVMTWPRKRMADLDGRFDVVVCQTVFSQIQEFRKSRIAMIQYGYAKEAHNYGAWRAFADLTLTFGRYAAEKIGHFCPAVPVGNPRYDAWHDPAFHALARERFGKGLDPGRRTILYAPTFGDLSSVETFLDAVYGLAGSFNVLLKMHHNTELLEPRRRRTLEQAGIRHFGANDDLLELIAVSDLVLSDYSGAIFDAMFCRRPVVLLNADIERVLGVKVDVHSIEYAKRRDIGPIVERPDRLRATVEQALSDSGALVDRVAGLRSHLFTDEPGATGRAAAALLALARGGYAQDQLQSYVRKEMIELYRARGVVRRLKWLRRFGVRI